MSRFREKFSTFFFGLTVGLLIGCGIFIFKLDDYVRNIRFSDNNKPEFEETTKLQEQDANNKKEIKKKQISSNTNSTTNSVNSTDSTAANNEVSKSDSLVADADNATTDAENISVLKEELVGVKNVKVKDDKENSGTKKDSLVASVAGVNENSGAEVLIIEFWKTPLNSKGYKMSRNKVLLYGLSEQNVDIVKIDDSYYLKNNNLVYHLYYSNEFRKMERVNESSILAKIN